jgi:hypothetical protein
VFCFTGFEVKINKVFKKLQRFVYSGVFGMEGSKFFVALKRFGLLFNDAR